MSIKHIVVLTQKPRIALRSNLPGKCTAITLSSYSQSFSRQAWQYYQADLATENAQLWCGQACSYGTTYLVQRGAPQNHVANGSRIS